MATRDPWQTASELVTSLHMERASSMTVILPTNCKDLSLESVKLMVSGRARSLVVLVSLLSVQKLIFPTIYVQHLRSLC